MEYLSTSQMAQKLHCSRKTVNNLAKDHKIPGAILVANHWMIPESYLQSNPDSSFRFPLLVFQDFYKLKDTLLNEEEKELYSIFENYFITFKNNGFLQITDLLNKTSSIYIKITCLYSLIYCNIFSHNYKDAMTYYYQFLSCFDNDFEYKKEMDLLFIDIMVLINGYDYLMSYNFDFSYSYNKQAVPKLVTLCGIKQIIQSIRTRVYVDPSMYELKIKEYEEKEYIFPLISLHTVLACIYYERNNKVMFASHLRKAYDLSSKYHHYFYLTELYVIAPKIVEETLNEYEVKTSQEFKDYMKSMKEAYLGFLEYSKKNNFLCNLKNDDADYIIYAVKGKSNKETSYLKGISEKAVSNRYTRLYERFNVANKKELVDLFIEKLKNY